MTNPDNYRQQAQYWSNYHLIDRTVKACVHVEDKNDVDFWNRLLHTPKWASPRPRLTSIYVGTTS